jgi:hypothetical protein
MKRIIITAFLLFSFLLTRECLAQLPPPTLIYPAPGAINIPTTLTFDWSDVSGAVSYNLFVQRGFDTTIYQEGITQSQYTVPTGILAPNTTYIWSVRTYNGTIYGNYAPFRNFTTTVTAPPPPNLSQPPNNATNVSITPTFEWNPSPGAEYYQIQVAIGSNFDPWTINASGITSTQYIVPQSQHLANGTGYFWRVKAFNQGGQSDWSTVWSFSTVPAPPPPPTLLQPPNNATNVSLTPLLQWTQVFGATAYHLILTTATNTTITDTITTNTGYQVPQGYLSGSTQYKWSVASINLGGEGAFSAVFTFTTQIGPPAAPTLVSPPNGDTTVGRYPLFDWNDVPNATSYRIQVSEDSSFPTGNLQINQVVSTSQFQVTITVLQNGHIYYWRVNASNTGGTSNWSTIWHFKVVPQAPAPPTLVYPPNGSQGISLTPTLRWNTSSGATSYRVQVATNTGFNTPVVDISVDSTQYTIPTGRLIGNTLYYWRVNASNSGGTSNWTAIWNFKTLQTLTANIRVLLEGFYNGTTQVQDTIKVYLANSTSPYAFGDSSSVYLSSSGNGSVSFQFAPNGSYYVVIKHRNHLETWSATPQSISTGNPITYDFTTGSNKAFGNNMKQVGSIWVFWGGDADQDGYVLATDYDVFKNLFGRDGYRSADFNGDTYVDGYDLPILYNNIGKSTIKPSAP